jgi:hypothetical protein
MPDIACAEGQAALDVFTDAADFIIVDNISTLVRSGRENEAEGWQPIQDWALRLRSGGKSVLFVHHAGKGGQQRGTSRREDVLDLVMELKRPDDYEAEQGARFEIHFTKARHLIGAEATPVEAHFQNNKWLVKNILDRDGEQIVHLKENAGMSYRDIAKELNISHTTAQRKYERFKDQRSGVTSVTPL